MKQVIVLLGFLLLAETQANEESKICGFIERDFSSHAYIMYAIEKESKIENAKDFDLNERFDLFGYDDKKILREASKIADDVCLYGHAELIWKTLPREVLGQAFIVKRFEALSKK